MSEDTIESLPLNGRNYTDLVFLQPGVIAFPFRDGGSVVAHGLGASVNGQDPRANVYLIDGTLMNDFTNGPAGSAASTSLGTETVREFRVEANAYSAEYGRSSGGQINVLTKSGTNDFHGSAYEYYRNDALDARNYFDSAEKPDFARHQFGATVGGPLRKDETFFFVGYEGLREDLGRTISTVVPNAAARSGILPAPGGGTITVPVSPAVRPYLDAYPLPNGAELGGGLAAYRFPFGQTVDQDYFQARLDQNVGGARPALPALHLRPGRASSSPPTSRSSRAPSSRRTSSRPREYRRVFSPTTLATFRLGYSRTRIGQDVEANVDLPPFVPGRELMGAIDIGGHPALRAPDLGQPAAPAGRLRLPRRPGPDARPAPAEGGRCWWSATSAPSATRPSASASTPSRAWRPSCATGPSASSASPPRATWTREWPFTLLGAYLQDDLRLTRNFTVNAGLRFEYATLPEDSEGRDINMKDLKRGPGHRGAALREPAGPTSPRGWASPGTCQGDGRTSLRGGYGLYYGTNSQQNLIVTVTNPPFTPRPVIANPTFPTPNFCSLGALSIRPYEYEIDTPRIHVWNVNVQRELFAPSRAHPRATRGRGARSCCATPTPTPPCPSSSPTVRCSSPPAAPARTASFSAIELKSSDGDSWYNALIAELRRTSARGLGFQASYTFSRNVDTTQASTFFSDATNGTVSAFPEFGRDYNKGLADYHAKHNLVVNLTWDLPLARESQGLAKALLANWRVAMIGQYRSGPPLTAFVQGNRSRSLWSPSQGPGIGFDRPNLAPGRTPESAINGTPEQWFDPAAFVLQPAGQLGNLGRGALIGPDLRVVDVALAKRVPWSRLGPAGNLELRVEAFNVLNHANFGIPSLIAFSGQRDGEAPLSDLRPDPLHRHLVAADPARAAGGLLVVTRFALL